MDNFILNYLAPYMVANGGISYAFYKMNEKKILENFDKMKTATRTGIATNIPKEHEEIIKIFRENVNRRNLKNFYYNIQDLKITKNNKLMLLGIGGKYSTEKNTIEYTLDSTLWHEVFHMASTYHNKETDVTQTGFVHYLDKISCCKALNEGYTDLCQRRVFNQKSKFYNGEVRFAIFLELLIGKENMEKYYFQNDFVGLVNHLSQYIDQKDVLKFFTALDFGFDMKKMSNPTYKAVYSYLELKLCELLKENNKDMEQITEYQNLIDESNITKVLTKVKRI